MLPCSEIVTVMGLDIKRARYVGGGDGRVYLELTIGDRVAVLDTEQSPTLGLLGYVRLGHEFEDVVPELVVPADPRDGRGEVRLRGWTDDARVRWLYWQYVDDLNDEGAWPMAGRELRVPGPGEDLRLRGIPSEDVARDLGEYRRRTRD